MSKTNPFAGLLAGFRGARAEDKPDDEEARKARRAEEEKQREEEDARRAEEDDRRREEDARRAEEDGTGEEDDKPGAEDDEDQDPEADADDGDDEAEEDMDEKEAKGFRRGLAIGRARENARASRIFLAAAQTGRPDLAATLAFTTRNSSAEAARVISTAGGASTPQGSRLGHRMARVVIPNPGTGSANGKKSGEMSFGEKALAAAKKAGIA